MTHTHTWLRRYPPKIRFTGVVSARRPGAEVLIPRILKHPDTIESSRFRRNSCASSCERIPGEAMGDEERLTNGNTSAVVHTSNRQSIHVLSSRWREPVPLGRVLNEGELHRR